MERLALARANIAHKGVPTLFQVETTVKPFRFLDLPRELRDEIYALYVVCDDGLKDLKPEEVLDKEEGAVHQLAQIHLDHQISCSSILRTSRQIYAEALSLIQTRNPWVRVTFISPITHNEEYLYAIPVLPINAAHLQSPVLELTIDFQAYSPTGTATHFYKDRTVMILARDLPLLSERVFDHVLLNGNSIVDTEQFCMRFTLPDPMVTDIRQQRKLLEPFRKASASYNCFQIQCKFFGPWDENLVAAALNDLRRPQCLFNLQDFMLTVENLVGAADRCRAQGKICTALKLWKLTALRMQTARLSTSIPELRSEQHRDLLHRIAELEFLIPFKSASAAGQMAKKTRNRYCILWTDVDMIIKTLREGLRAAEAAYGKHIFRGDWAEFIDDFSEDIDDNATVEKEMLYIPTSQMLDQMRELDRKAKRLCKESLGHRRSGYISGHIEGRVDAAYVNKHLKLLTL